MKQLTFLILILGLVMMALCASYPPRRNATNAESTNRGNIFAPMFSQDFMDANHNSWRTAVVDGGRLGAECVVILSVTAILALGVNMKRIKD